MPAITEFEFKKMPLEQRYKALEQEGFFIERRIYRGMEVFLYKMDHFYVEAWKRYMLSEVCWIEVVPEKSLEKYADSVNLKKLLGN
ncbi:MAG: hypothetical protein ACO1PI_15905 [Bacteroidota bacterium]